MPGGVAVSYRAGKDRDTAAGIVGEVLSLKALGEIAAGLKVSGQPSVGSARVGALRVHLEVWGYRSRGG